MRLKSKIVLYMFIYIHCMQKINCLLKKKSLIITAKIVHLWKFYSIF